METVITILTHPIFWLAVGAIAKAICPAAVPFLGMGKKLTQELIELHNQRETANLLIADDAQKQGLKLAAKAMENA
jgi:hypothetical protein